MFLNIRIDLLTIKTYYGQFILTSKRSLHIIFKGQFIKCGGHLCVRYESNSLLAPPGECSYYAVVLIGLVVSRKISGYLPCPASNRFLCTNTYLHKNFMRIDTAFKVIVVQNVIITTVIQAAVSLCSKRSFENLESRFGTIAQLFNSQDRQTI